MEQAERGGEKRERLCCVLLYGCRGRLDSVAAGAYVALSGDPKHDQSSQNSAGDTSNKADETFNPLL